MFASLDQLKESIAILNGLHSFFGIAFLAFKQSRLPVGSARPTIFSNVMEEMLQKFYRPSSRYAGFYSPFVTSSPEKRWLSPRYGSTSLQRIVADTFADAFIHEKGESSWGWKKDYVSRLETLLHGDRIPAFHLAVWLFRDDDWTEDTQRHEFIDSLIDQFNLGDSELKSLFDTSLPETPTEWLVETQPTPDELFSVIGHPPGHKPLGAALQLLGLRHVGPAKKLDYLPAERLNIITGDNSLGKTFILDTIWWALTGNWYQFPALPPLDSPARNPRILFGTGLINHRHNVSARFNWTEQKWVLDSERESLPGLVIYARHDGSFAVWDVYRAMSRGGSGTDLSEHGAIKLSSHELWNGKRDELGTAEIWLCNGLIRDWVSWQSASRFENQFKTLTDCLIELSPDKVEPLRPGEPVRRLPLGAREVPTLKLPYGDVPLPLASAGVQRAVAIAYMMVWSWYEHLVYAESIRRDPQRQIVLLVDEVEAHLHPKWQRVIVPALMNVVSRLSVAASAQLHIATHSPMVMASIETLFDEDRDGVFHLQLVAERGGHDVQLEAVDFVRRGTIDRWLLHPVFGLQQARSQEGERAVEDATKLQQKRNVTSDEATAVHARLKSALADDDPYWPRWLFFAKEHGAEI